MQADFQEAVRNYLVDYPAFELFGSEHVTTIFLTVAASLGLPWIAKRHLKLRGQVILGSCLGFLVAGSYCVWILLEMAGGTFRLDEQLPLHLCWIANLLLPVVMLYRSQSLFEIVFYWGIVTGLQATFTPTVEAAFPHIYFIRYVLAHNGMFVTLVYASYVYDLRPTARGIWRAFLIGNLLLITAIPVNLLLGSNYFFLCLKPKSPTLLDFLGPWPWYILTGELVALMHFVIAYIPFSLRKYCQRLRVSSRTESA